MKKYFLLIIALAVISLSLINLQFDKKHTDDHEAIQIITPYIKSPLHDIEVLFHQQLNDEREGLSVLTVITHSTKPPQLNKGRALSINYLTALNAIKVDLPGFDFGDGKSELALSYRWEDNTQQWGVTSIETSNGYYFRWQRIVGAK